MRDVLVVGAGPAGSATAIHLARKGRSVVLVDRARFPRRKACGEGIFPQGVAELAHLGVLDTVQPAASPLSGIRFTLGNSTVTGTFPRDRAALGIQRSILDAALVKQARECGVDVREGIAVRALVLDSAGRPHAVATDAGVESARVIVAADGLNSRFRQQAELDVPRRNGRYGISAHIKSAKRSGGVVDVRFRQGFELYLTPAGCGLVNVAVLGSKAMVAQLAKDGHAGFKAVVEHELGAGCTTVPFIEEPSTQGPFNARSRHAHRGKLVLAGDAAGFFDGISGEGISLGLLGARDCAEAIDRALRQGSTAPFRDYERRLRRRARNSTLLARLTLFLARHPRTGALVLGNLARRPATFDKLIAINSGDAGLRDLRPTDIATMLAPWPMLKRGRG